MAIAAIGGGMLTSCSNEAEEEDCNCSPSGLQPYYFSIQDVVTEECIPTTTDFTFNVYRSDVSKEATVELQWEGETDSNLFPSLPTEATFAADQSTVTLTVPLNIDNFDMEVPYYLTVNIPGTETTTVSQSYIDFMVVLLPWTPMGNCEYTDYFISSLYGADPIAYEVEIQKNVVTDGLYRLVDPYGEAFPYNEPGDWDESEILYMYINATNAENVYICDKDGEMLPYFQTSVDWGDGLLGVGTLSEYYQYVGGSSYWPTVQSRGWNSTFSDGVITIGATAAVAWLDGDGPYGGTSPSVRSPWIVLPADDSEDSDD